MKQQFSRFRKDDEGGVSTLEFVIIAPVLFFLFLATFEAGWMMTRQMMLDRGVDMAMREVRLNLVPGISETTLRANICDEALGITNCDTNLRIEMRTMDEVNTLYPAAADGRNWPHTDVKCQDRNVALDPLDDASSFDSNAPDVLMVVVACVMVDPLVPGLGRLVPGLTAVNDRLNDAQVRGYKMVASSAYKAEPDK